MKLFLLYEDDEFAGLMGDEPLSAEDKFGNPGFFVSFAVKEGKRDKVIKDVEKWLKHFAPSLQGVSPEISFGKLGKTKVVNMFFQVAFTRAINVRRMIRRDGGVYRGTFVNQALTVPSGTIDLFFVIVSK